MKTNIAPKCDVFELLPLLEKYNRPGPRYTSYPTAPVFNASYTADEHEQQIRDAGENISLYVHLPFCDTLCYFCGCTMLISNNRERVANYIEYLGREIEKTSTLLKDKRIIQLHWGGGTPTHLRPDEIRALGRKLHDHFNFADDAEISVEIDPREIGEDHIRALADVGFRRASIGVQDIDETVQKAINRIQPEALTREVIGWCRRNGFESINVDLIYGLPFQTRNSFNETVEKILTFDPDRIALYNFAYVPWLKPHQKLIQVDALPHTDEKLLLFADATTRFVEAGYDYIGMDHFAKPTDELALARANGTLQRNFQGYSTRAGRDLIGLGMSAISHIGPSFSQNEKVLDKYYVRLDNGELPVVAGLQMTDDDLLREHVIMRLMCDFYLDKRVIEKNFHINFDEYFATSLASLSELQADSLVEIAADSITITDNGHFFIRNIAMCFDAYLAKMSTSKPMFSKTL